METHIPRHGDSNTKRARHRDSKTKKSRQHRDSGTKTPRHWETEKIKPWHGYPKAFFQRAKSHDIEIPRLKNHDIEISRLKTTASSFCAILTLMPPDSVPWYFLAWEFALAICLETLPRVSFVYRSKPFFYESKSCIFVNKSFLIESKLFLHVS